MAFVQDFQNDIFVSYAHVDDDPLPGADRGWVSTFVGCLRIYLAQKLGRSDAFSLWMDHELLGSQPITRQLIDRIQNSATLIVVLSPGYAASSWCKRERETFLEFFREQSSRRRFFVVERDMVEDAERPAEFRDFRGFRFWIPEREGKSPRILGSPAPSPSDHEYYNRIDDLSREIVQTLRDLKAHRRQVEASTAGLAEPCPIFEERPTVFLAQVTDDLELERSSVKRFLDQAGIRVVPDVWYSQDLRSFREAVARDLAESELFVQLLSGIPGKRPPDLPQGYLKCQLDLADAAGKPVVQWRNISVEMTAIEDEEHRALLEAPTVRAEPLEDFKQQIRRRVLEKPVPPAPSRTSAFVFVDMDSSDRSMAEQVCKILERRGADFALPLNTKDSGELRRDLERNLAECDALIVIYGEATAAWVRAQILECRKAFARRERRLRSLAVFEGPPEQKDSLDMKFANMGMRIVNCRYGLCEDEVTRFLDSVAAEV
ncbi:MAG: toll/interleukin-1 receptor domain-containing protein [Gammaproteobacteria bacterium]